MTQHPAELETIIAQMVSLVKEAYRLGGKHKISALLQAAGEDGPKPAKSSRPSISSMERGYRPGTAIETVHKYVQDFAGRTTKEIVKEMYNRGITEEKTVRTSLNRLRDKWGHLIVQREGKWYPR